MLKSMHFVCIFLQICSKFELFTSQGSAATYVTYGEGEKYCLFGYVAHFILFPTVK